MYAILFEKKKNSLPGELRDIKLGGRILSGVGQEIRPALMTGSGPSRVIFGGQAFYHLCLLSPDLTQGWLQLRLLLSLMMT